MQYLQELANQLNMPYVKISLDVGAAMKAGGVQKRNHTSWKFPLLERKLSGQC